MTRKRKASEDQLTFSFTILKDDLIGLEGGSQEALSDFEMKLRQTIKAVLDAAAGRATDPLDRFEVAARMSRLLGREITKTHLDQWTALSTVQRRIHVDALKALCEVTRDFQPLHFFVESCGLKALSPEEAVYAEFGSNQLLERVIKAEGKNILARVDEDKLAEQLIKRVREKK